MKQRSAVFTLLAGLTVAMCFASQAVAQEKATLRLDWTALGYHAPFYLGVSRGYYRDAGIDLTILKERALRLSARWWVMALTTSASLTQVRLHS